MCFTYDPRRAASLTSQDLEDTSYLFLIDIVGHSLLTIEPPIVDKLLSELLVGEACLALALRRDPLQHLVYLRTDGVGELIE